MRILSSRTRCARSHFQFDTRSRLRRFFRFIGRVVVSAQKVETAQDAGCDTDHCNQERNSGHGLSFGGVGAIRQPCTKRK